MWIEPCLPDLETLQIVYLQNPFLNKHHYYQVSETSPYLLCSSSCCANICGFKKITDCENSSKMIAELTTLLNRSDISNRPTQMIPTFALGLYIKLHISCLQWGAEACVTETQRQNVGCLPALSGASSTVRDFQRQARVSGGSRDALKQLLLWNKWQRRILTLFMLIKKIHMRGNACLGFEHGSFFCSSPALALLTSGAESPRGGGCLVRWRLFDSVPGLQPLDDP